MPPIDPVAEEPTGVVIKTILGLVLLLGLAYAGGHPKVQRVERALRISQVITAGFPFVALGVLARLPSIGVLTDSVLDDLGPLLRIGLGWIGFIAGFRFDVKVIAAMPKGMGAFVTVRSLVTFACIVAASGLVLLGWEGITRSAVTEPTFLRDALLLGTAGALTSRATYRLLEAPGNQLRATRELQQIVRLEELTAVLGLLAIAAYFRPQGADVTWQMPGTAWLLLTLGAGVAVGLLVYAILLRTTTSDAESLVLILGSVAFASGLAANLQLSPIVVCFVAGLFLANFPGDYKERLSKTLRRLERPIYLLFLLVAGALWRVRDGRGWVLMAAFIGARLLGKWLGTRLGEQADGFQPALEARQVLVASPMDALSIAIVVNAEILYPGGSIPLIVTAILGGAIVMEVLVQMLTRGRVQATETPLPLRAASVDEPSSKRGAA